MVLVRLAAGFPVFVGVLSGKVVPHQAGSRRAIGDMVLAARGLKIEGHNKASIDQKIDDAEGKSDTERQEVGAGMCAHERDKVESGHLHEAAREDADDAKEVHGHGKARR